MWFPAALTKLGGGTSILGPDKVGSFARWAPGIAAVIITAFLAGKQGIRNLFRPLKIWKVPFGWYLFALLFQPALFLVSKWIDFSLLDKSYEVISPLSTADIKAPFIFIAIGAIISAVPGAFMEELGWRAFALPGLQSKNNALSAGVILGLLWGIWHVPSIMYFEGTDVLNMVWVVVNTISTAILFAWIFNNTQGSLLLVTLFHMSIEYSNIFLGVIPSQTASLLKWLVTIIIVIAAGATNLSRNTLRIQSD